MNPPDDGPNEFSALDTLDLLAAFLHAKYGEQALREAFAQIDDLPRESLEQAAEVLAAKGLSHVAAIVADMAASRPSGIDLDNPYEEGSTNWRYWRHSWLRKRWVDSGEMAKDLRRRHASQKRRMH